MLERGFVRATGGRKRTVDLAKRAFTERVAELLEHKRVKSVRIALLGTDMNIANVGRT